MALPEAAYDLLEAIAESRRMEVEAEVVKAKAKPTTPYGSNGHSTPSGFAARVPGDTDKWAQTALSVELAEFANKCRRTGTSTPAPVGALTCVAG